MKPPEHVLRPDAAAIADLVADARAAFVRAGLRGEAAALDADVLARHVLGWDLARLLAHGREPPPPGFRERYHAAVARRLEREPVAFITGHREFWNLDFTVTPDTLVPRPETEIIVEDSLRRVPADADVTILDIGTGSGCLAVALAHERPRARVVATDRSHAALLVARANARAHGVGGRILFVRTDLSAGLALQADLIVSNPPYVPQRSAPALPRDVVGYEPHAALFAGDDGLAVIRRLFEEIPGQLAPGGRFIVEFGFGQEDDVRAIAVHQGWKVDQILADLQGIARTMVAGR